MNSSPAASHRDSLAALLAAALASCSSSPEPLTPAAWVKENTKIVSQLGSYQAAEQQEGIQRFLKLSKEQGTEVIFYLLNDRAVSENERVTVVLARIAAMWKDPRGVSYLLTALATSQDEGVVRIAEEGLIDYGGERAIIDRLEELSDGSRVRVRMACAQILSRMRDPRAVAILGKRLKSEPEAEIRGVCLLGVAESDAAPARTAFLIDALTDPDVDIRQTAWQIILEKEKGLPRNYDPNADIASRSESIAELRRRAGIR
jgi:hypothetical protein